MTQTASAETELLQALFFELDAMENANTDELRTAAKERYEAALDRFTAVTLPEGNPRFEG
jgi:hypothetical protein